MCEEGLDRNVGPIFPPPLLFHLFLSQNLVVLLKPSVWCIGGFPPEFGPLSVRDRKFCVAEAVALNFCTASVKLDSVLETK